MCSIYVLRWWLYTKIAAAGAQIVASVLNVAQIQIMTVFFNWVAFKMTDAENRRTDDEYEDSMIIKLFCFSFVNNYASFYFLAFIAGSLPVPAGADPNSAGECGYPDCMTALAINLGVVFGLRITLTNAVLWAYPYVMRYWRRRENASGHAMSEAEMECIKEPFDMIDSFLLMYSDISTFFGYTVRDPFYYSPLPIIIAAVAHSSRPACLTHGIPSL